MPATYLAVALICAAMLAGPAHARGSGGHSSGHSSHGTHSRATPGVARDSHGKIARSRTARSQFQHSHPCPATGRTSGACPGYVIDHVTPLKRGGADSPSNMQWQTREEAKIKDRTE